MPAIAPIDDPEDARVAPYRAVRERDLARQDGLFVAEGEVVVRLFLSDRARFRPDSMLVSESRRAFADEIAAGRPDLPVYVASRPVMDRIVGFPIHRGILAIGRRGVVRDPAALLPGPGSPGLVLGLLGLANHDNVGGAFRNAAAFGADAVLLDSGSCDPLYRKAIRVSVGAVLTVPFARGGTPDAAVAALADAGFELFALGPAGDEPLHRVAWPARCGLLVGQEGAGLPARLLSRLRSVRIDMAPGFDSLNVATASGIALHAVRCGRPGPCAD